MVADVEIHTMLVGIVDSFHSLDAAVKRDDQSVAVFSGIVYALERNTVSFIVTIRNIELDLLFLEKTLQVIVNHSDCRRAVNVVISVNQHLLVVINGTLDSVNGFIHVLHQEWVVKLV